MADDLRSRIETLIASTPYVIGKDCYMVKVSDLKAAIAAASVPSPPAQENLPESLAASIALFREDPAVWWAEWQRKHDFKVYLITENERLKVTLPPSPPVAELEVIVNGQPVVVTAGTVRAVIEQAIRASGQIGAPVAQWELRTTDGDIVPHNLTDGTDYELTPGRRLWLNLGPPSPPAQERNSYCPNTAGPCSCGGADGVCVPPSPPVADSPTRGEFHWAGPLPKEAIVSACAFVEARFGKARCDNEAVSECVRCSALAVARWLLTAIERVAVLSAPSASAAGHPDKDTLQ